jgi:hypothetical protein
MANAGIIKPVNDFTKTDLLQAFTSPETLTWVENGNVEDWE